jgi:pSer/pThr/pTyr-binding forkhead associated (FHA) protein
MRLRLRPGRFSVELTRSGMVFGRHSSADVRLPLPDVSRRHCRFTFDAGRWLIVDLDSLNGIFVNDTLVGRAELHDRDVVRIGGFVFDVELHAAEQTVELTRDIGEDAGVLPSIATAVLRPEEEHGRRAS